MSGRESPSLRPFLSSCAATLLCSAIAIALRNAVATPVLLIIGLLLGIPISIVLYLDYLRALARRAEGRPRGCAAILLALPTFLLGCVSLLFGISIVIWVLYNTFIERLPHYSGPVFFTGFGIGPLLIFFGWHLIRSPYSE